MEFVSLVLAVLAIAVAMLALRRADLIGRRVDRSRAVGRLPVPATVGADAEPRPRPLEKVRRSGPDSGLADRIESIEGDLQTRISRVGVVRYDAFEGAGGQLSFSLAMLDERGNGLVLTSIHAPSENRVYLKEIPIPDDPLLPGGLSPEEQEALRKASPGTTRDSSNGGSDD